MLAITAVAGNVPLALTERNARKVCELAGQPICRSMPAATGRWARAGHRRARARQDGAGRPRAVRAAHALAETHAADAIIELLRAHPPGTVTLCPIGPLTNIATALRAAPDVAARIKEIVLMGGAIGEGNITPAAGFNIYVDPHAAKVVFEAGAPLVCTASTSPTRRWSRRSAWRRSAGSVRREPHRRRAARFYNVYDQTRRGRSARRCDPARSPICSTALFGGRRCHVAIETRGEHTLGPPWSTGRDARATRRMRWSSTGSTPMAFALLMERLARLPVQRRRRGPGAIPRAPTGSAGSGTRRGAYSTVLARGRPAA